MAYSIQINGVPIIKPHPLIGKVDFVLVMYFMLLFKYPTVSPSLITCRRFSLYLIVSHRFSYNTVISNENTSSSLSPLNP